MCSLAMKIQESSAELIKMDQALRLQGQVNLFAIEAHLACLISRRLWSRLKLSRVAVPQRSQVRLICKSVRSSKAWRSIKTKQVHESAKRTFCSAMPSLITNWKIRCAGVDHLRRRKAVSTRALWITKVWAQESLIKTTRTRALSKIRLHNYPTREC